MFSTSFSRPTPHSLSLPVLYLVYICDHDIVVSDFDIKPHTTPVHSGKVYRFSKANWDHLKKDLETNSNSITQDYNNRSTSSDLWNKFKNSLQTAINKNIQSSLMKKRSSLPWLSPSLHRMLRRKQRLLQRAKQTGNWNTCRNMKKSCRRATRRAEWDFINGKIQEGPKNNNTKPFWNFIKSRKQDNTGVSPLKVRGQLVSDSPGKAGLPLQQFKSVFTQDTYTTLPPVNSPSVEQIEQIKVTTPRVAKLLRNLNPAKAPGPDNIPNQVLKTCADQIAPALRCIYQKSLDTGTLPADWLEANISCVFKKGDRHQPENYRPISLTSVPCKILEHIICHHIHLHLESNNILTHLNHGFRSGYSCKSQLLTTTHDLLNSFDQKIQVDITILDFSKAFDTVPHRKLLHKLSHYGITEPLHKWLTTFLTHRTMRVVLEGTSSEKTSVDSGVTQGTILGPLLFLLHINDLPNCVKSRVRLFADDCLLYRKINTFQDH